MNWAKALRDHYLRIDARSLGLFRLAFGLVLIGDLVRRWAHAKDFYSNDGVVPNHAHLFQLQGKQEVWSLLHAVTSPGEADAAFCVILFVYLGFLAGVRTRAFHLVSLVCLVSLTGRDILLENAGNYAAIGLLAFTAFLPLGSRFSIDSLRVAMAARDEKNAAELDDRRRPSDDAIDAARAPGWTPTSLAALAVLLQIAVIHGATALQQRGDLWRDGSALHYALNVERWVSGPGAWARGFLGPAALSTWTRAFHAAAWAVPILILLPILPRITRGLAVGLAVFHALTIAIFFSFGLYGFTLLAAAALLIPKTTWDLVEEHPNPRLARTVLYDADCGVCLMLARLLKQLDLRGNITLQGNDDLEGLCRREGGGITRAALPAEITAELVERTIVAVDPQGRVSTRARAIAEIVQALPLGWSIAWIMRLPGVVDLLNVGYDAIATRRMRISVALGKEACGVPWMEAPRPEVDPTHLDAPSPAQRLARRLAGTAREALVALVLFAALAQTTHENALGVKLPRPPWAAAVATWPRMIARWDVLTSVPTEDEILVIDAQTKDARSVDLLTGKPPETSPGARRGTGLGQLWNDYLTRIRQREWSGFQQAFKDYLARGGPAWRDPKGEDAIVGCDAWWLRQPIPKPGEPRERVLSSHEKLFTQGRGGRLTTKDFPPLHRPDAARPPVR